MATAPTANASNKPKFTRNIVPGAYVKRANRCQAFTHTIYINGQPTIERGTARRNPDGNRTTVALLEVATCPQIPVPQREINDVPAKTPGGALSAPSEGERLGA